MNMETQTLGQKLHELYMQALDAVHAASGALVEDDPENRSTERALREALYAAGCFKRAVRATRNTEQLRPQTDDLRNHIEELLTLLEDDAGERMRAYLSQYFDAAAVKKTAAAIAENFAKAVGGPELYKIIQNEKIKKYVFDLFARLDTCAVLAHPHDAPHDGMRDIAAARFDALSDIEQIKLLKTVFADDFLRERKRLFVPDEEAYSFWYAFREMPSEAFNRELENALVRSRRKKAYQSLVGTLPRRIHTKIRSLNIEKHFNSLLDRLGDTAENLLDAIAEYIPPPVPLGVREPMAFYEFDACSSYSCQTQKPIVADMPVVDLHRVDAQESSEPPDKTSEPSCDALEIPSFDDDTPFEDDDFMNEELMSSVPDEFAAMERREDTGPAGEIRRIVMKRQTDLQKMIARAEQEKDIGEEQRKELIALACVLGGDEKRLEKLLEDERSI